MKADAIIIGSGQAGLPLATKLAAAGKRVLLVERGQPGGTCVNTGCTPTKTMIASARAAHVARSAGRLGVHTAGVEVDLAAVVRRKDDIVGQWRAGVTRRIHDAGERLTFIAGHARFAGERTILVGGERHEAPIIVINVGARPVVPPLAGLEALPWLDNRRVMELTQLPSHLVVIGGGYVGCEFAQMFRRFGAQVTIIDGASHLMHHEDDDVCAALEGAFRAEGIALELATRVEEVGGTAGAIAVRLEGGKEIRGSHLLVATGRRPNTDDLGCAAAGVTLDAHGFVVIDDQYRTSAAGVYAVGDATGEPQFTHVAWDDHRILLDLLLERARRDRSGRHIPYAAFTDPQLAGVGLREKDARARGIAYELATMPFGHIARAIEIDERAGLLKVLVDARTDRVLGAAMVGAEAAELIHILAVLMQAQASARAIVDMEFVHPALAEGVQSLLMRIERLGV